MQIKRTSQELIVIGLSKVLKDIIVRGPLSLIAGCDRSNTSVFLYAFYLNMKPNQFELFLGSHGYGDFGDHHAEMKRSASSAGTNGMRFMTPITCTVVGKKGVHTGIFF
jgi:hypothetical protein